MVLAGLEEKSVFFFEGGNSQHVHEKNLRLFQLCKLQEGTKFREQVKGKSSTYGVIHTTWWVYCIVP